MELYISSEKLVRKPKEFKIFRKCVISQLHNIWNISSILRLARSKATILHKCCMCNGVKELNNKAFQRLFISLPFISNDILGMM